MSGFPAPWSLCGGWAVDAWLGRKSRDHGDVDMSVFAGDQRALFKYLDGWQLLAHDAAWEANDDERWWDGRRRLTAHSHIHARPPELTGPMPNGGIAKEEDGFSLEFYIDDRSGDDWVLLREPRISMPVRSAVRESPWGLPTIAPEALLFFKAGGASGIDWPRRRDKLDFNALLPELTPEQREWLRHAIAKTGHPWLRQLSGRA
jgi:hypothetical protein